MTEIPRISPKVGNQSPKLSPRGMMGGVVGRSRAQSIGGWEEEDTMIVNPRVMLRQKVQDKHLQELANVDINILNSLFDGDQDMTDASPTLNKEKFVLIMKKLGSHVFENESLAARIFDAADTNQNGNVDKKELILGLISLTKGSIDDKLKFCFRIYDINGDGHVEKEEVRKLLQLIVADDKEQHGPKWINNFIEKTFRRFGKNGMLSADQFAHAAKSRPVIMQFFSLQNLN